MVTDFSTLLRTLQDRNVAYILVGAAAATVHGSARLTLDVDVVYQRTRANVARLVRARLPLTSRVRAYLAAASCALNSASSSASHSTRASIWSGRVCRQSKQSVPGMA